MTMSAEYGMYVPPDHNVTKFSTGHRVQQVEIHDGFLVIDSPQYGSYVVGNNNSKNFFYDYFTTADSFRSLGVSQLSKKEFHATIPNTADFTRYWHITDLFRTIEHFAHRYNIPQEEMMAYVLHQTGTDKAHGQFSHATDILKEDYAGREEAHEQGWPLMAVLGGSKEVLDKYGIKYDADYRIKGIELPPWVDCKRPNLDADSFQYAVAEMLLWFDHDQAPPEIRDLVRLISDPENLSIKDGQFVFEDADVARVFSKAYLLLTTEHWNDPINRVQLHLLIESTKRAIARRRIKWMDDVDKGVTRSPEGYLFGIDDDIVDAMDTGPKNRDDFMFAVRNLLHSISMQERERFINYKQSQYAAFLLDDKAHDYPSELLNPKRVEFGPESSVVTIEATFTGHPQVGNKIPEFNENDASYNLHPLKNRYIDPLVFVKQGSRRVIKKLSDIDANYRNLLKEQQQVRSASVVVRLALTQKFEADFVQGIRENRDEYNALLSENAPEMTLDQQRQIVELGASAAKSSAIRMGRVAINSN